LADNFGVLIAILLAILPAILPAISRGHVADRASRRYVYARLAAGPVTTCRPAHLHRMSENPARRLIP
jgi:hypothetical protein